MVGADASDLDRLAEALRRDGVVVDRMLGSGAAKEAHDRIAALVREVPFPVYVALVEQPDGLPSGDSLDANDALAGLLNRRLGDGLFILDTTEGIHQVYSFGLGADPSRLSLAASSNVDMLDETMQEAGGYSLGTERYVAVPATAKAEAQVLAAEELVDVGRQPAGSDHPATLDGSDADRLAEHALQVQAVAGWRPDSSRYVSVRTASSGLSALVGGLSALIIALLLGQTLRGWPRFGKPGPPKVVAPGKDLAPPPDPDEERRRATELADALAASLAATVWESVRDREVAGRALTARDAIEGLLGSADVADLIGAQVLARAAAQDLVRGRRGAGEPTSTCFFDPRHLEATTAASWRLGDGDVDVPCCVACATAVAHDGTPAYLRLATRRGTQPYWERDDVWARTGFGAITDFLARDVLAERAGER